VRVDAAIVTSSLRGRAEALMREAGAAARLLLSATHTHAGPGRFLPPVVIHGAFDVAARVMDDYDPEVETRVASAVSRAARAALADLSPASLGVAAADAPDLNADRRCQNDDLYGPDYRDRVLTVLRVDRADSQGNPAHPFAVLVHHAMHGTVLGGANTLLSTDAPGAVERAASDLLGVPVLFLQGDAGDVSPATPPLGQKGLQNVEWIGMASAPAVADAFARAAPGRAPARARLSFAERPVELGVEALGYAPGQYPEYGGIGCLFAAPACVQYTPADRAVCVPLEEGSYVSQSSIAALRVDDVLVVTLPGEPTTGIGARVRELGRAAGAGTVLVAGYAQDHLGYILEQEDFLRGGYEPSMSIWGWKLGAALLENVAALLRAPDGSQPPLRLPSQKTRAPRTPSASAAPPAVDKEPENVERLETVRFSFLGGDPGLGAPRVSLEVERNGAFVPAMAAPGRPLEGGPEIILRYEAHPSHREEPDATRRVHRWTAEWETLADTPAERYRFVARGKALTDGGTIGYGLTGAAFEVRPGGAAGAGAQAWEADGKVLLRLRFPPNPALFERGADPAGNYRLRDVSSSSEQGALVTGGVVNALLAGESGGKPVRMQFDEAVRAHAVDEARSPQARRLEIPAGGISDAQGNSNSESIVVEVQP